MKKIAFILALMFVTSLAFSQAQTISQHNGNVSVTPEWIKTNGEASQQNGDRSVIVLTFEGLGDQDAILNYYDGGLSGLGFGPGPAYGIQFVGNTLALIDADAGGSGNFANEPSPSTVMFFLSGASAIMNVPAGFTTGFSFFYTANVGDGFIDVYDGLNGTGNVLASLTLPINWTNDNCTGDPTGQFCHWDPVGVSFSGTAKSVAFGGVADHVGFDDVTFGSETPGPQPVPISDWAIFIALGLILVAAVVRFRRII